MDTIKKQHNYYKILISKDEETGYFVAEVPNLAPCITFGETLDEAMDMAYEAIEAILESKKANGYEIDDNFLEIQNTRKQIEMYMPMNRFATKSLLANK